MVMLTNRETQVKLLKESGLSYNEIGSRLGIAIGTVKTHLQMIKLKEKSNATIKNNNTSTRSI